jgi:hypothetical protein
MVTDGRANGGATGTSGGGRRLGMMLLAGFLAVFMIQGYAIVASQIADLERSGANIPASRPWVWITTSLVMWLTLIPVIWWAVARVRPPRFSWWQAVVIFLAGSVVISAVHIGGMMLLRIAIYAVAFPERYEIGDWWGTAVYEYRKDLAAYVQFVAGVAVAQWLLKRADEPATPAIPNTPVTLAVADGSVTHHVPVDEIEQIASAGNYVEISWGTRTLLHRATLAAVEAELGAGFVRVHRSRLVRRAAIRRIETDRSGDFAVTLASGAVARGSRRFRAALDG